MVILPQVCHRCLSQKIRHLRWSGKRKSDRSTTPVEKKKKRFEFISQSQESSQSNDDFVNHVNTLQKEFEKERQNSSHVNLLLKESLAGRRSWISTIKNGEMQPIVKKFPCFEVGEYVLTEFCMLTKLPMKVLKDRAGKVLKTILKMEPCQEGPLQMINVVLYIEECTKFDRGKGTKTKSVITIHEDAADLDKMTATSNLEPPHLVIFTNGDFTIQQAVVCGDQTRITFNPEESTDALLLLLGVYYVFDLEYPKIYSQVLGFLQQYLIGEKYDGIMSSKYHKFATEYLSKQ